jgi:hypothetical protein
MGRASRPLPLAPRNQCAHPPVDEACDGGEVRRRHGAQQRLRQVEAQGVEHRGERGRSADRRRLEAFDLVGPFVLAEVEAHADATVEERHPEFDAVDADAARHARAARPLGLAAERRADGQHERRRPAAGVVVGERPTALAAPGEVLGQRRFLLRNAPEVLGQQLAVARVRRVHPGIALVLEVDEHEFAAMHAEVRAHGLRRPLRRESVRLAVARDRVRRSRSHRARSAHR